MFLLGFTLDPNSLPALIDHMLFRTKLREDKPDHLRRRPRRKPPWYRRNDVYPTDTLWYQPPYFLLMMLTIPWHYSCRTQPNSKFLESDSSLPDAASMPDPDISTTDDSTSPGPDESSSAASASPGPDESSPAVSTECQDEPSQTPNLVPDSFSERPHLSTLHRFNKVDRQISRHVRLIDRMQRHRYRHWILRFRQYLRSQFLFSEDGIPTPTHKGDTVKNLDLRCDPRYSRFKRPRGFFTRLFSLNATSENEGDAMVFDTDSIPFAIDPCATATIVNSKDHLLNLRPVKNSFLTGVGGKIPVVAMGTLRWHVEDDSGQIHQLKVEDAFYVPESPLNLLCPQQWAAQRMEIHGVEDDPYFRTNPSHSFLSWNGGQSTLTVPHDSSNNLPLWRTAPGFHQAAAFICKEVGQAFPATVIPDDSDSENDEAHDHDDETIPASNNLRTTPFPFVVNPDTEDNAAIVEDPTLPEDSQTFLDWHYKLGHTSPKTMQHMAELGLIPRKLKDCRVPKCPACIYGKQTKRPWRTKSKPASIGKTVTKPGQCVSVDQLSSPTPGLIAQVKGNLTRDRYRVATVFVDHFSDLTYVHVSQSDTSEETVEAKEAFERFAATHGVTIQHYHADNGRFADNLFREAVQQSGQSITYCGVGAHHQNGIAERRIRDLTEHSRTMLLHAQHRWPKAVNAHLWPYAIRMAVNIRNHLVRQNSKTSPIQVFSDMDMRDKHFPKTQHPFGCPVYVLDAALHSGKGKPKWSERSRLGVYLGYSPEHASSVALVLNLKTGHVSPQFHVVFDDKFDCVKEDANFASLWQTKADLPNSTSDEDLVGHVLPSSLSSPWYKTRGQAAQAAARLATQHAATSTVAAPPPAVPVPTAPAAPAAGAPPALAPEAPVAPPAAPAAAPVQDPAPVAPLDIPAPPTPAPNSLPAEIHAPAQVETREATAPSPVSRIPPPRHSSRIAEQAASMEPRRSARIAAQRASSAPSSTTPSAFSTLCAFFTRHEIQGTHPDKTINDLHPFAFASSASKGDPDVMHLQDARKQEDWPQFKEAMSKEVEDFNKRKHWRLVKKSSIDKSKPYDIVNAVWSFKRKRSPIGELLKHKARLCAHGGQQTQGVTYWDTYSPVVNWFTLRSLLTLSIVNGWHSRSVDFVLAFPQAEIKSDVYMKLPYGFHVDAPGEWLLKLEKNVYGLKDAGKTWHEFLKEGLIARGFKQGEVDPCVFYKEDLILMIYVDDVICFSPKAELIDEFVASMQRPEPQQYVLEDLGDVTSYLGLNVTHDKAGTITLTQPHLIDKVIKSAGFERRAINPVATPACEVLKKYPKSRSVSSKEFHYRSVIGQLNYLAATTRPDIAFAVHQCARFCNDPKEPHVKAVKRIVRYLVGTRTQGLILDPSKPQLDMYVDADFAGGYDKEHGEEPASVYSRTGFIIKYAGCPLMWQSKLQTEIALSTTEAEYIALSYAMRSLLPVQALFQEVQSHGFDLQLPASKVHCTVFEDNAGCIELATAPKIRPRTKHIALKYHHFRSHVKTTSNPDGTVTIAYIPTKDQQADIFTKDLPQALFEHLRIRIMGW